MDNNVERRYLLTSLELTILLAGKEMQNIVGIQNKNMNADSKAVCLAMNHLYQQGILCRCEQPDGFVIETPLQDMLMQMKQASAILIIQNTIRPKLQKILYLAERPVLMENSTTDRDAIGLSFFMEDTLLWDYEEVQLAHIPVLDEEQLMQQLLQKKEVLKPEEVEQIANITDLVEYVQMPSGNVKKRWGIHQEKQKKTVWYYDGKHVTVLPGKEESKAILEEIIREAGKNDIS